MSQVEKPREGRRRVIIEGVTPQVDCGRFPIKRVVGEEIEVRADIFTDGHDEVAASLLFRREGERRWQEHPFEYVINDRWRSSFTVETMGRWEYTIEAWVDHFRTWIDDYAKKRAAEVDTDIDLVIGGGLVEAAAERAEKAARRCRRSGDQEGAERAREDAARLKDQARLLQDDKAPIDERRELALSPELLAAGSAYPDRELSNTYRQRLEVWVDRPKARFSAWYEFFPRSCGEGTRHAGLKDCEKHLEYVAAMGFDVAYLPPIHPIGLTKRKGPNNRVVAGPEDPGSPWAIGGREGGHKSIHPQLGSEQDLRSFIRRAEELGMEVALDIAFQASPDHPWVEEHPEWFRWRPDGTVQFAENPPKKYEDIYPINFESEDWQALWEELEQVMLHWVALGVKIFRVDNPHTKPFAFWEWAIAEIQREHPEVLFLAEAFTRPKVMYRLAKLGFSQSYTYFAWRNAKWELEQYFTELTQTEAVEFFRPNVWPNTPDILTEYIQFGGRPAAMVRLFLAATLSANYGVYGPAFELVETAPREPGSEEYLNSEKYEIRDWDLAHPHSLRELIALVNRIRRENPALHANRSLRFHGIDNEQLIAYSKRTEDGENVILAIVNLDPYNTHSGWTALDLRELNVETDHSYYAEDLLGGAKYVWQGAHNFVQLEPGTAHIFRVRPQLRSETDFNTYM